VTPYEAVFKRKPSLSDLREWGEKVWVRIEGGDKLGGRVREGRWMGLDERSNGVRVYWPSTQTVTVERNVYYDDTVTSASRLEGEEWSLTETTADTPITTSEPPADPPDTPAEPNPTQQIPEIISEIVSLKRNCKPSQRVAKILKGNAVSSNRPSDPKLTTRIQFQLQLTETYKGEGSADWIMANEEEYALAGEISEVEAIEPRSLAEVM
jgi:hypothetical protein